MLLIFLFPSVFLWLFVCFMHVFRFNWCIKRTLDFVRMKYGAWEAKGSWIDIVPTCYNRDDSWERPSVLTHPNVPTRSPYVSPKHYNFSALSSFHILTITSSTDIQMKWFKFFWKDNLRSRTFMKGLSEDKVVWNDKNTLEVTIYIKSCNPLFKGYLSNCNSF